MLYKELGKTGKNTSVLGFGAMRLPMTETAGKKHVDYDKAVPIIKTARRTIANPTAELLWGKH